MVTQQIGAHQVRQIAVKAEADPGTVKRVLLGLPTRQMPRERILRAMRELGLLESPEPRRAAR